MATRFGKNVLPCDMQEVVSICQLGKEFQENVFVIQFELQCYFVLVKMAPGSDPDGYHACSYFRMGFVQTLMPLIGRSVIKW